MACERIVVCGLSAVHQKKNNNWDYRRAYIHPLYCLEVPAEGGCCLPCPRCGRSPNPTAPMPPAEGKDAYGKATAIVRPGPRRQYGSALAGLGWGPLHSCAGQPWHGAATPHPGGWEGKQGLSVLLRSPQKEWGPLGGGALCRRRNGRGPWHRPPASPAQFVYDVAGPQRCLLVPSLQELLDAKPEALMARDIAEGPRLWGLVLGDFS